MSTTALSQIACFSSINRERRKGHRIGKASSLVLTPSRSRQFSCCMQLEGSGTQIPISEKESTLAYGDDTSRLHVEGEIKSYRPDEEIDAEMLGVNESVPEPEAVASPKKTAKIHDFCLGIPFGGLVLSGGLVGSIFSRNLTTLGVGVLFGGGLLALSTFSLKVWRDGKSSLPFILGQSALAVVLLYRNLQNYFLTKKIFPGGFYAVISAAMLCFYSYVLASGGNPPPKKLKVAAAAASAS